MIVFIDSGIGGLQILRETRTLIPDAAILYYADSQFMPYGSLPKEIIFDRIKEIVQSHEDVADLFVVACNTATVSIIDDYRKITNVPFVGVEPGIKPAAEQSKAKSIAILSTARTATSPQIKKLISKHAAGAEVHVISCENLAEAIERKPDEIDNTLKKCLAKIPESVDTIALACTHYSLIKDEIHKQLPDDNIVDISQAVAQQVKRKYPGRRSNEKPGSLEFETSGNRADLLERIKKIAPDLLSD